MTEGETLRLLDASIVISCDVVERDPAHHPGRVSAPVHRCGDGSTTIMRCRKCGGAATMCDRHVAVYRADVHTYTHTCGATGTWAVIMEFVPIRSRS